ncbi:hypothetical protein ACSBL2_15815 [Pedobacter sp. AW31-3R]|uniref:hypothetical protein n=1 Tax=Pedobacter sp. AW31-3R TaxID=3445781 RepID=UPI003F9FE8E3
MESKNENQEPKEEKMTFSQSDAVNSPENKEDETPKSKKLKYTEEDQPFADGKGTQLAEKIEEDTPGNDPGF